MVQGSMPNPTLYGLLNRGYFPKELPPAFNTHSFARAVRNTSLLPHGFLTASRKNTKNINYSYLARANSRRRLGIINPIDYLELAVCIIDNWRDINPILLQSKSSITTPQYSGPPNRAFTYKHIENFNIRKATIRSRSKYLLKADISQFYHSIYTHSITWAIHTKPFVKANINNRVIMRNLSGDKLDRLIRRSQENQTIGIPIGPDTSYLIAEIILSICDKELRKARVSNYLRFIDDYEFGCESLQVAESYKYIFLNTYIIIRMQMY